MDMNFTEKLKRENINEYDIQRIFRENISVLEKDNDAQLDFVDSNEQLPYDVALDILLQVDNNSAEILYLLANSDNRADLQTFIEGSPLFREGRTT